MNFLYLVEKIRTPILDFLFLTVTHLGEEIAFLAIAILFFWCIDKRRGYFILLVGLVGTALNQILKLFFKIPRPWIKDPSFTFVGDANVEATGYSFPSGHTQNAAGTFGVIGLTTKKKWVKISAVAIIVLVAFSRTYLGVHTPLDVLVSLLIAAALIFLFSPIFKSEERFDKAVPYICLGSFIIALGLLLYAFLIPEEAVDAQNLYSAKKNSVTLFSCMLGFPLIYYLDKHFIRFETKARWYAQVIKATLGLGVIILIKSGLSAPLVLLFGNEFIARGVRYFLIVFFAGAIWPMSFGFFSRLKIEALDRFGEWFNSLFKRNGKTEKNS